MHDAIARACLPCLAVLVGLGLLMALLVRVTQLRIDWSRLPRLAANEQGGVQSLAFVLTFPIFLLLFLFIVQISQLMIAVGVVQYASFAAARAASVWIPADVNDEFRSLGGDADSQNELPPFIAPGQTWTLDAAAVQTIPSRKCREIWTAAVVACAPICPSGGAQAAASTTDSASLAGALAMIVSGLDPAARNNARMPARIAHKIAYGAANTSVDVRFVDRSNQTAASMIGTYNPVSHPIVPYLPSEVGWQDAVVVTVHHRFKLMPGPGRWLAAALANGRVTQESGVYRTTLQATTTMSIEGLQSLRPTLHPGL